MDVGDRGRDVGDLLRSIFYRGFWGRNQVQLGKNYNTTSMYLSLLAIKEIKISKLEF